MRFALILSMIFTLSSMAAINCRKEKKLFEKDFTDLTQYVDGASLVIHKTTATESLEMVKEFLSRLYDSGASSYAIKENSEKIQYGLEAGTTTEAASQELIVGTAHFIDAGAEEREERRVFLRSAFVKVAKHPIAYGYDASVTGADGQSAVNLLFLIPECRVLYPLHLVTSK